MTAHETLLAEGITMVPLVCGSTELHDGSGRVVQLMTHKRAYRFTLPDGEVVDLFYLSNVGEEQAATDFIRNEL